MRETSLGNMKSDWPQRSVERLQVSSEPWAKSALISANTIRQQQQKPANNAPAPQAVHKSLLQIADLVKNLLDKDGGRRSTVDSGTERNLKYNGGPLTVGRPERWENTRQFGPTTFSRSSNIPGWYVDIGASWSVKPQGEVQTASYLPLRVI